VRFGGRVLAEQDFTIGGQGNVDAMNGFLSTEEFDGHTAVWSALDHAYQRAADIVRTALRQPVSIVLMTDGVNNAGIALDEFLGRYQALPPAARAVHTYTIRFGEADPGVLDRAARATGGHLIDATATSLQQAFKETRGCR
jgi:Ca-activated chloride channel family protein